MMRHLPIYIASAIAMLVATVSCNDDTPQNTEAQTYSSVAVTGFNLKANDSVLKNLDSVFFAIDLNTRQIFNADSLPKGTKVDRLLVNIKTPVVGNVEIIVPGHDGVSDTTINYITSPNDSIDFSHGPVSVRVTSYDRTFVATYTLKVNVHREEPDSLYWNEVARRNLPTALKSAPTAQKAVATTRGAVVLTVDAAGNASIARAVNPSLAWESALVTLPAGAIVETLSAKGDNIYIIAGGKLYESTDTGASWTDTGTSMTWIYGACGGTLLGCNVTAGGAYTAYYPSAGLATAPIDPEMPVSSTSATVSYDSKWAEGIMTLFVGGRLADGTISGATWAWESGRWARIDTKGLPRLEAMTLINYKTFTVSKVDWSAKSSETLLALGGRNQPGTINYTTYMSTDRGMTWKMAPTLLQLPEYILPSYRTDALVYDSTLSVRSADADWTEMPGIHLPAWYRPEATATRATEAITSWECPYIYLFGGIGEDGKLLDNVWRGAINRLTFIPIY